MRDRLVVEVVGGMVQGGGVAIADEDHVLIALLPRLSVFALCLTGNLEQRDDLVQETCVRALARKDQWQPGAHLDTWMFRIAHDLWFDRKPAKRFRKPKDIDHPLGSDARAITESGLVLADLLTALDQLSPEHRAMIALVCIGGLTYSKAAEVLRLPVGTMISRLARGRLALCDALTQQLRSRRADIERSLRPSSDV